MNTCTQQHRQDKTILIVDDEPAITELVSRRLKNAGYHCLTAQSATKALQLLQDHPVALVLADLEMPGMSGIELLIRVSNLHPNTVRVVLSGIHEKETLLEAVNKGHIHGIFTKPINFDELIAGIQKTLAEQEKQLSQTIKTRNLIKSAINERDEAVGLFQTLTDTAGDAIAVVNEAGKILYWNTGAEFMFGYSRKEAIGADAMELLLPHDHGYRKRIRDEIENFRSTGQSQLVNQTSEALALRRDGHMLPVEISVSAVQIKNQWRLMGIARDISGRKEIEHEQQLHNEKLQASLIDTIRAIGLTVEKRDPYTAGHQNGVAKLASAIARELSLHEDSILGINLGATIHDIGKIYIPAEILNRPGKLTTAEFEMIKSHPLVGHEIIEHIDFPWPIKEIVRQHHERLDGSGYPDGLKGDEILYEAQILAVADVVEAISSHRPYRPSLGVEIALEELEKRKEHWFNPDIVDVCITLFNDKQFSF